MPVEAVPEELTPLPDRELSVEVEEVVPPPNVVPAWSKRVEVVSQKCFGQHSTAQHSTALCKTIGSKSMNQSKTAEGNRD